MGVLVIHPGRQHSHQLALALHRRDRLQEYWTGVPVADPETKGPLYRRIARLSPQATMPLPGSVVRHNYLAPLARRLFGRICSPAGWKAWQHRVLKTFDRWSARRLPESATAVICYENSARETFRSAKRKGITTILDAASFHYEWQDAVYDPVESKPVHDRINAYKDDEIRLADHILAVSELARQSYVEGGVSSDQVTAVPMGADLTDFVPNEESDGDSSEPFTFIFAGYANRRKGGDLLLSASERLASGGHAHRVQFAGDHDDTLFERTNAPVEKLGYLDRSSLAAAFREADCLVLPSRHDSFGRVVVEALATGLPVIVSEHVGAKEVISEGETGWVVGAEAPHALADRMRLCIEHPEEVRAMQDACTETAQNYSWSAYHQRVMDILQAITS